MNGYGVLAIFAFFGIITAIFFIFMMICAVIDKSKLLAETACKLVFVYIAVIVIYIAVKTVWSVVFDLIPELAAAGDQMTR